ncbi:heterokaryon incompatibility protein-domain-containing protein [Apodospora peruviana]|uniref:Heterokaryon incompatibility protein-domain-containing protein n=1 Tax=Apodospora peruviana TaxID=516989 RepID=A0AAE0HU95_9PEZI|nr:heterokaryon incompatibility protein-domain-containing protein [Apodospora peruviana]
MTTTSLLKSTEGNESQSPEFAGCSHHPLLTIGGHTSNSTSSEKSISRAREWMDRCHRSHRSCATTMDGSGDGGDNSTARLPDRVVHIISANKIRVAESSTITPEAGYACLSHRWSPETEAVSLKRANLETYKRGVHISSLPQMFQDVMGAVNQLGLEYVWIDSLCIVQDDLGDWHQVASSMASIYEGAAITVFATSCASSSDSLFSNPNGTTEASDMTFHRGCGSNVEGQAIFPLLTRAWVLQERLLSRRILHFTDRELFWECREATWCECRRDEDSWTERRRQAKRDIKDTEWADIVETYSDLELTLAKDKLTAIEGIATRFGRAKNWNYVCGLWAENFENEFLWRRYHSGDKPRPHPRTAPTWSRASVDGKLLFPGNPRLIDEICNVSLIEPPVEAGRHALSMLKLSVRAVDAHVCHDDQDDGGGLHQKKSLMLLPLTVELSTL